MQIKTLAPNARFRLSYCERTGTVLRQGNAGTVVRYDGTATREFTDRRSGERVAFTGPAYEPMQISGGTEVEVLA